MIRIHYNSETQSVIAAYDSGCPVIPSPNIEVTEAMWAAAQGDNDLTVADGALVVTPKLTAYENAVQRHIDAVAAENDFDNILTCAKYIGFDNAFQAHAAALLAWNAACWGICHTVMDAVQAGIRTAPSTAELIAELPTFNYEEAE